VAVAEVLVGVIVGVVEGLEVLTLHGPAETLEMRPRTAKMAVEGRIVKEETARMGC
jgi:hypothetical protein